MRKARKAMDMTGIWPARLYSSCTTPRVHALVVVMVLSLKKSMFWSAKKTSPRKQNTQQPSFWVPNLTEGLDAKKIAHVNVFPVNVRKESRWRQGERDQKMHSK